MRRKYKLDGIAIEGVGNLVSDLNRLVTQIDSEIVEDGLLKIAEGLRDNIKAVTPRKTGRLKSAVRASRFRAKITGRPAVFVAMNYKKAPHAHLVEYGHRARNGKFVPAHPYFRPTLDMYQGIVLNAIDNLIKSVIK